MLSALQPRPRRYASCCDETPPTRRSGASWRRSRTGRSRRSGGRRSRNKSARLQSLRSCLPSNNARSRSSRAPRPRSMLRRPCGQASTRDGVLAARRSAAGSSSSVPLRPLPSAWPSPSGSAPSAQAPPASASTPPSHQPRWYPPPAARQRLRRRAQAGGSSSPRPGFPAGITAASTRRGCATPPAYSYRSGRSTRARRSSCGPASRRKTSRR